MVTLKAVFFPRLPPHLGKLPYMWALSLTFMFWKYVAAPPGPLEAAMLVLTMAVFLPMYFASFSATPRQALLYVLATCLLGALWSRHNLGAGSLFIFACGMCGGIQPPRRAYRMVAAVLALAVVVAFAHGLPALPFLMPMFAVGVPVGIAAVMDAGLRRSRQALARKEEEVEHMARIAERERISRDLHDLLGHSLSLIALKAELAGKLAERDPAAARREIRDVEAAARQALSQVRAAVTGYRESGLSGALASARAALAAAGIEVHEHIERLDLAPALEHVVALALREAVTNVVRHSGARRCTLELAAQGNRLLLRVTDDGKVLSTGRYFRPGNGLTGMRERAESAGGRLTCNVQDGFALELALPMGGRA